MLFDGAFLGPIEVGISRVEPPSSHLPEAILGFAGTAVWGLLALLALILFREPIARFLSTIGGRISKIAFAGIELELASAPKAELPGEAKSFGSMDPQGLASDSTSQTLVNALAGPVVSDSYAIIDLGIGKSWLISRLFIFAIMLRQVRGVRCFVFVDGSGRAPNEYLGTISAEDIRGALAQRYPWLERVFAKAYKDRLWHASLMAPMATARTLNQYFAADVVQEYVALLKQGRNWLVQGTKPSDPPPEPNYPLAQNQIPTELWVQVGSSMEYGRWIDRGLLFQDFKDVLQTDQVPRSARTEEKIREVVISDSPFLAVVRASGQFVSLIDRGKVLDDLAKRQDEAV
jgi:hypothetical protein